jgi:MSHA biogenesis protein MshM
MARAIADTKESRSIGRVLAKQNLWLWPAVAVLAAASALLVPGFLGINL